MWFMFFPLIYTGTIMPYQLSFYDFRVDGGGQIEQSFVWDVVIRWTVDIAFMIDLCLGFVVGYYDVEGVAVTDLSQIRTRYLSSFFIFDLIACMPPEIFDYVMGDLGGGTNANKLTRLPRVTRLSRITRLARMTRLSKFMKMANGLRDLPFIRYIMDVLGSKSVLLSFSVMGLVLLTHIMGCLWYLVSAMDDDPDAIRPNWISNLNLREESPRAQWWFAMYYVYTVFTTVGFGDISPVTMSEISFTVMLMLLGVVINSVIVSEVIAIVARLDSLTVHLERRRTCVRAFVNAAGISEDQVARKLLHWTEYHTRREYNDVGGQLSAQEKFSSRDRVEFQKLVWSMPEDLLSILDRKVFLGIFAKNLFFVHSNINHQCIVMLLASHMRPTRTYEKGEFVYEPGSMPVGIFFVESGALAQVAVPMPWLTILKLNSTVKHAHWHG
jgi:hypothetical protein